MPPMHDDNVPADPIVPQIPGSRRCQKGWDYRTLPNWVHSGQQTGQGGPGGALVDTAVSSWPWAERASGAPVGARTPLLLASSRRGLYATADCNRGQAPGRSRARPDRMRSSRSLTLGLETFGGLGAWRSVTLTGESSCDRTPGLDGVILIKAGRDRDEAVSVRAMLPRDLVGPIPQCAARINASAVSLRRSKLPIDDDPSARYLFLADSDRPHGQPVLIPSHAVRFTDRHELVERFENSDRAGYVTVADLAPMADMCEERLAHGATDRGLTLRKGDQTSQGSASSIIVPSS